MKIAIVFLIILIAGVLIADDSLFVHDSMFVYYSELGDSLLSAYHSNSNRARLHGKCLTAYWNAIEALKQSKRSTSLQMAKAHFQLANAVIETDTLWRGAPYVENWRLAKSHFLSGKFSLGLRLYVIAGRKHDKKRWAQVVEDFEKYFKAYIWLLETGGDPQGARKIKQDFERYRLLFR